MDGAVSCDFLFGEERDAIYMVHTSTQVFAFTRVFVFYMYFSMLG